MKNKLLPLIFVLGSYSAYSQVGIGTPMPNSSSQLEVVANDKGVLIPRVTLTSSTDVTTIKNGNVNSLLVFNTATVADIKPGYYYWYDSKWNRISISNEAYGVAGGDGAPGNKGEVGYPGENISIYTDHTAGVVYVQNLDGTWTAINGKNGIDGKNGINGGSGLPGDAGLDGTVQMYIDYTTGIVYVRDPQDPNKWIPVTGKDGMSGGTGLPGEAGLDATVQMYVDKSTGIVYVRDPEDSTKWVPLNGKNGIDGKNGINGGSGLPGDAGL
ncbi:hypothetical protein SHI72_14965, partial [Flavobacterium sp. PL02]|nr:hypothetical protein [Flavobacterium sp. PL02]